MAEVPGSILYQCQHLPLIYSWQNVKRQSYLCCRYIDDLIVFNNNKFLDYLKEIYPSQLTVEKANKSDHLADYLDLTFIIDSGGKLSTGLYDKRDDFDSHIVNFPFLSRTYHLALLMVCTFHSSLDMHDAAHTMMISDIVTSAWLIDYVALRSLSRNITAEIRISLRNTRG